MIVLLGTVKVRVSYCGLAGLRVHNINKEACSTALGYITHGLQRTLVERLPESQCTKNGICDYISENIQIAHYKFRDKRFQLL